LRPPQPRHPLLRMRGAERRPRSSLASRTFQYARLGRRCGYRSRLPPAAPATSAPAAPHAGLRAACSPRRRRGCEPLQREFAAPFPFWGGRLPPFERRAHFPVDEAGPVGLRRARLVGAHRSVGSVSTLLVYGIRLL